MAARRAPDNTPWDLLLPHDMPFEWKKLLQNSHRKIVADLLLLRNLIEDIENASSAKIFQNELSGFVMYGRPNNNRWRFYIRDDDADNPRYGVEPYAGAVTGDHAFPNNQSGPVQYGRYNGGLYRWWVDDTDQSNPRMRLELLANDTEILPDDYVFEAGQDWMNRGRDNLNLYQWYPNDRNGASLAEVRMAIQRFGT